MLKNAPSLVQVGVDPADNGPEKWTLKAGSVGVSRRLLRSQSKAKRVQEYVVAGRVLVVLVVLGRYVC